MKDLKISAAQEAQCHVSSHHYADDQIDLRELVAVLWRGRLLVVGITALFSIAAVFYALSLPNEYRATAIVAPASAQSGGNLSKLAGQFGGLASLAGVSLGAAEITDDVVAMELMKTWGFIDTFIKKHELQVSIFAAAGWDRSSNQLILDENLYDQAADRWVRNPPKGRAIEPTSWELYEVFFENLHVIQNKDNGLINVSYTHYSPEYAKNIATWLIEDVNTIVRDRALADATRSIAYLESQIDRTPLSDMQNVFYSLIQEQTKTKMLAEVSDEYVFRSISKALVPEEKIGPKRALICIFIAMIGFTLGCIFLFFRVYIYSPRVNGEMNV